MSRTSPPSSWWIQQKSRNLSTCATRIALTRWVIHFGLRLLTKEPRNGLNISICFSVSVFEMSVMIVVYSKTWFKKNMHLYIWNQIPSWSKYLCTIPFSYLPLFHMCHPIYPAFKNWLHLIDFPTFESTPHPSCIYHSSEDIHRKFKRNFSLAGTIQYRIYPAGLKNISLHRCNLQKWR